MAKRAFNKDAPFQSLRGASYLTGLSIGFLREGCKKNSIPHIMAGKEYRVNMPLFMEQLEAEAAANMRSEAAQ